MEPALAQASEKESKMKKEPNKIESVPLHNSEYQILCMLNSITLAYKPKHINKKNWPAISFCNSNECRKVASELLKAADILDNKIGKPNDEHVD